MNLVLEVWTAVVCSTTHVVNTYIVLIVVMSNEEDEKS